MTISVVRPVGTGCFVCGHLITTSLTANPLNRKFGIIDPHAVRTENLDETARCGRKMVWFLLGSRTKQHDIKIKYAGLIQRLDLDRWEMMAGA